MIDVPRDVLAAAHKVYRWMQMHDVVALHGLRLVKPWRRQRCAVCGKYWADPPSDMCPGCEAYEEHQR